MTVLKNSMIGNAGEYFVCAELCKTNISKDLLWCIEEYYTLKSYLNRLSQKKRREPKDANL